MTGAYWAFTLTDGAIHMLVVLHFHNLGFSPLQIAFLFLFYEVFGIITNGVGGWIASHIGLNRTMITGGFLQVFALGMLTVDPSWLSVAYVMTAMALSGIAKDLNKMSAKSSVKLVVPKGEDADTRLFKWVAILTGSKNTLKGVGLLPRRTAALSDRVPLGHGRHGGDASWSTCTPGGCCHGTGGGQGQGEVQPDLLQDPGDQHPLGGAVTFCSAPGMSGSWSVCRCFWPR